MTRRKLAPEEAALWERVIATVKPLEGARKRASIPSPSPSVGGCSAPTASISVRRPGPTPNPSSELRASAEPEGEGLKKKQAPANTLDGSWDRNLSRGLVSPESSVDLHGLSLASAYDRLDRGLADAIARGDRVLLLVTGKPPRPASERPHARGAIRAAVGDWLAASRHSGRIAAVRAAHPRHGGAGALYIVLRRAKSAVTKPKS